MAAAEAVTTVETETAAKATMGVEEETMMAAAVVATTATMAATMTVAVEAAITAVAKAEEVMGVAAIAGKLPDRVKTEGARHAPLFLVAETAGYAVPDRYPRPEPAGRPARTRAG
ncbi:hypothetical protein MAE02_22020 [Microvirga aerophila]|uniref:Uncharacterized protein n=2 Tax=Microvirga aerophila TaxID=670291 RepID=A0A512BR68_9HYPH|nr:hypothetical protein MAE02_22020 [Microvirga aerophila]